MAFGNLNLKTSYPKLKNQINPQDIENINKIFEPYGLKIDDIKESSQVIRYIINLPLDSKLQGKIRRAAKDIEYTLTTALNSNDFTYNHAGNRLIIECQGELNIVPFGKLYTYNFHAKSKPLSVVLGVDLDGKPIFTDLSKAPHMLIAGSTGSGKSETIHAIIASILMHNTFYSPANYIDGRKINAATFIDVIDMKGTEYNKYKNIPHGFTLIRDEIKAFDFIDKLCNEMENRYYLFAQNGCSDIDEYISMGNKISRRVCIIDEFADLILKNRKIEDNIVRLAQKSRACGIHLIIGTQSPRAIVITGLIKANIPLRIALRTSDAMESRIIMDENGAEKLYGKGDMLIKKGGSKPIRAQGCFVCDEDKENLVKIICSANHNINPINIDKPKETPPDTGNYSPAKKVGFFQGLKNLWNAPPCTTASDYFNIINNHR